MHVNSKSETQLLNSSFFCLGQDKKEGHTSTCGLNPPWVLKPWFIIHELSKPQTKYSTLKPLKSPD